MTLFQTGEGIFSMRTIHTTRLFHHSASTTSAILTCSVLNTQRSIYSVLVVHTHANWSHTAMALIALLRKSLLRTNYQLFSSFTVLILNKQTNHNYAVISNVNQSLGTTGLLSVLVFNNTASAQYDFRAKCQNVFGKLKGAW